MKKEVQEAGLPWKEAAILKEGKLTIEVITLTIQAVGVVLITEKVVHQVLLHTTEEDPVLIEAVLHKAEAAIPEVQAEVDPVVVL